MIDKRLLILLPFAACAAESGEAAAPVGSVAQAAPAAPDAASCDEHIFSHGTASFSANPDTIFWSEFVAGPNLREADLFRVPRAGGLLEQVGAVSAFLGGGVQADPRGAYLYTSNISDFPTAHYFKQNGELIGSLDLGRSDKTRPDGAFLYIASGCNCGDGSTDDLLRVRRDDLAQASPPLELVATTGGSVVTFAIGDKHIIYLQAEIGNDEHRVVMKVAKGGGTPKLMYSSPTARIDDLVIVGESAWVIERAFGTVDQVGPANIIRVDGDTGEAQLVAALDDGQQRFLIGGADTAFLRHFVSSGNVNDISRIDADSGAITDVPLLQGVFNVQIDAAGAVYFKDDFLRSLAEGCF